MTAGRWLSATMVVAIIGLSIPSAALAGMYKSYDFNGNLSDTLGAGLDLIDSGGSLSGGRYSFSPNQGLRLDSALNDTANYGIEFKFQVNDSLAGWNKLIDFQNLAADSGLYFLNGNIQHYTLGGGSAPISLNTDFVVGFERAGGIARTFLNGVLVHSAADGGGQGISGPNILNFFEDDVTTGKGEAFVGSVDWIRIHDDSSSFGAQPVPEPASIAMWSLGALGIIIARRRRNRKVA